MRVEATSASYLYTASLRATERVQKITAHAAHAASAPQAMENAPRTESSKSVDFTHMTRRELREWTNEKFLGGELSFDEMSELATLGITGLSIDELKRGHWFLDDGDTRYNYMQIARDAMPFARTYDDGGKYLHTLETTLSVMQRFQGQSMSVDVFA